MLLCTVQAKVSTRWSWYMWRNGTYVFTDSKTGVWVVRDAWSAFNHGGYTDTDANDLVHHLNYRHYYE